VDFVEPVASTPPANPAIVEEPEVPRQEPITGSAAISDGTEHEPLAGVLGDLSTGVSASNTASPIAAGSAAERAPISGYV
jgi:hypothetical protein